MKGNGYADDGSQILPLLKNEVKVSVIEVLLCRACEIFERQSCDQTAEPRYRAAAHTSAYPIRSLTCHLGTYIDGITEQ